MLYSPTSATLEVPACLLTMRGASTYLILPILLSTFVLPHQAIGQPQFVTIAGRVLSATSGAALPGANVFVSGTTIGTAADFDGQFEFRYSKGQQNIEVVASMVGFVGGSQVVEIAGHNSIVVNFELEETTYQLEEITVASSNEEWKALLAQFQELAFSTTPASDQCTIVQPEFLSISRVGNSNRIRGTSSQPFEFLNEALGYRVRLHSPRIEGGSDGFQWEGNLQFEELEPESESQAEEWRSNRRSAFLGSPRHFFSSLSRGSLTEDGFFVATTYRPGIVFEHRVAPNTEEYVSVEVADPTVPTWALRFEGVLAVSFQGERESMTYRRYQDENGQRQRSPAETSQGRLIPRESQQSWLELNDQFLIVDSLGNEYGHFAAKRYGYWEWERLCEALPLDYSPTAKK